MQGMTLTLISIVNFNPMETMSNGSDNKQTSLDYVAQKIISS